MTHDDAQATAPPPDRRAAGEIRRYTRFVALMRWLLPASALALAAAVVVWPHLDVAERATAVDVGTIDPLAGDRPTMTNARFLGADGNGNPYVVTATAVWRKPDGEGPVHLENPRGVMTFDTGVGASFRSDRGVYDRAGRLLEVEANVDVFTDDGYEFHSEYALIDLDNGVARGHFPVVGRGPAGEIRAQGFRIAEGGDRLVFDGRVHLTVFPGAQP